ncbi:MAG TPA: plasmid pRiA4b ORF-3 family protein [Myxococcales bacterium]|nr:plasmid pRiA4b ORF-3 family protein [Myxococcales bacterium]
MAKATKRLPRAARPLRGRSVAYVLKVTLREVRPPIWRRVRVAGDLTLRELHHVLQIALGWTDSHLHEFEIGEKRYGMPDPEEDFGEPPLDEQEYELQNLLRKGNRFEYHYDFGDDWRHQIVVEREETPEQSAPKAECLAGARGVPPEDCGGPSGYADLLEALADPAHERHAELREWAGPYFAPEEIDLALINRELRGAGSVAWRRHRERFYRS